MIVRNSEWPHLLENRKVGLATSENMHRHTRETASKMILPVTGSAKGVFHQWSVWSIGVMERELT